MPSELIALTKPVDLTPKTGDKDTQAFRPAQDFLISDCSSNRQQSVSRDRISDSTLRVVNRFIVILRNPKLTDENPG